MSTGLPGSLLEDLVQKSDLPVEYHFVDASGDPIDISGCIVYLTLTQGSLSNEVAIIPIVGSTGVAVGTVRSAHIDDFDAGFCSYELKLITSGGYVYTIDQGIVAVLAALSDRVTQ